MARKPRIDTFTHQVLDWVRNHPGATSHDIAPAFGALQSSTSATLTQLSLRGLLRRQKIPHSNGTYAYFIAEGNTPAKAEDEGVIEALALEVAQLTRQVEELEAWKAAAITAHPDLVPVDPLLLRAREIVAAHFKAEHPEVSENVLSGKWDNTDTVTVALAGLKSAAEASC